MDVIDAQDALIARIKSMPDRPAIHYPSGPKTTAIPRIVVQVPAASERTITLGGKTSGVAEIVARVETEDGNLDNEAKAIVKAIVEHFPVGLRVDGVKIHQVPNPRARYEAGGVYHIPVIIRGRFYH